MYILRICWVDSVRIQQQKLLADGGFAYVYSGLDADSGDRDFWEFNSLTLSSDLKSAFLGVSGTRTKQN